MSYISSEAPKTEISEEEEYVTQIISTEIALRDLKPKVITSIPVSANKINITSLEDKCNIRLDCSCYYVAVTYDKSLFSISTKISETLTDKYNRDYGEPNLGAYVTEVYKNGFQIEVNPRAIDYLSLGEETYIYLTPIQFDSKTDKITRYITRGDGLDYRYLDNKVQVSFNIKNDEITIGKNKETVVYDFNTGFGIATSFLYNYLRFEFLIIGNNSVFVSYQNQVSVKHNYKVSLKALNYKNSVNTSIEGKSEFTFTDYGGRSFTFDVNLNSSIVNTDDYKRKEEVKFKFILEDLTDGVTYVSTFSYPIGNFENNFCEISNLQAATNGDINLGALRDTNVYIDMDLSAFSAEDRVDYLYIRVTNPRNKDDMEDYTVRVDFNSSSTKGTLGGWGQNRQFSKEVFSFVPKSSGNYKVEVLGYNYLEDKYIGNYNKKLITNVIKYTGSISIK